MNLSAINLQCFHSFLAQVIIRVMHPAQKKGVPNNRDSQAFKCWQRFCGHWLGSSQPPIHPMTYIYIESNRSSLSMYPWVGSTLQLSLNIDEENPGSGLAVGTVMESWPSPKLPSLVPGGKWLPFSQVGGIPTSEREPHWWHINRVPNNVTRSRLTQTKWFVLLLARAFSPKFNDWIQSFSLQPLILCLWLPNQVTWWIKCLEPISRWRTMWTCHSRVQRTYRSWKHQVVLPPTFHLGPWPGGHCPVALI